MSSIVPPTFPLRRVSECDFKAKCDFDIKLSANECLADTVSEPAPVPPPPATATPGAFCCAGLMEPTE